MSNRWQYQVVEVKLGMMGGLKRDDLQEMLARQGQQGWELVQIVSPGPMQAMAAVFKRPA